MKSKGWVSKLPNLQPTFLGIRVGVIVLAMLLVAASTIMAQDMNPAAAAPETKVSVPDGYTGHHSIDLGGRMTNLAGSGAMYNTLVNLQSGPRVQGETFEMHALPGNKHALVDDLKAFGTGFGGDPNVIAKLDASKSRVYEFSGVFRRDRQYFDYDLLGNPNITTGQYIPIGPSNAPTGRLVWPSVNHSPVMFNTVRRMTDTNLTLKPFATFTYRLGYSHSTMEGPTLSPSYTILKYDALLQEYQRNGSDNFLGALDWKPSQLTKITIEMEANHYKADSFFTLDPNGFLAQEANGTPVYLGNWDSETAYGIGACNTTSMGAGYTSSTNYTILSPANTPGGRPIINPACAVVTSYMRTQPTRIWTPTETVRLQTSALKNISMNGDVRYTLGTSDLLSYYESAQGLSSNTRSLVWSGGYATTHRAVFSADYGIVWQAAPVVSIADQVSYTSVHQPGNSSIPAPMTLNTPTTAGNATINYSGALTPGVGALPHGVNGTPTPNFFGFGNLTNNLTVSWEASSRARFALTYRYSNRNIGQGVPHTGEMQETDPVSGEVSITENAGIFNATVHPAKNWDLNGTVEIGYSDNALTPVSPRQSKVYRVHTIYKPNGWATISGSYSDRERHNNTNNAEDEVASGSVPWEGPLNHVDFSRVGSAGLVLSPNEHYGISLNYSYSDVYTATNICFTPGSTATLPGAATVTSNGVPNLCPGIFARGSTTQLVDFRARDFEDAPTQFGSVALNWNPIAKVASNFGYTVSDVNGSRFFNDARDVNGSLVSKYQTPFVNIAYTMHPGLVWKAEYNYFGYGEGGPSGAPLCSTTVSTTATIVPCSSFAAPTGLTEPTSGLTAPRVFHANNVTLGVHYEF